MGSFSIDDVRESFSADMTLLLDQVAEGARAALARPLLAGGDGEASALERLGDGFHAMFGTSSLVAAAGLTQAAGLLERVAGRARADLEDVAQRARRARRQVELLARGAAAMREMLALELEGRGAEAALLADGLAQAATAEDEVAPPATPGDGGGPWSFDGGPTTPAPEGELVAIFREEAARMLGGLGALLAAVATRPDDQKTVEQIERVFHTLKGAAATVGLAEVARLAADMQHALEAIVDGGGVMGAELIADAARVARAIAAAAGLSGIDLPAAPAGEPREAFSFPEPLPAAPPNGNSELPSTVDRRGTTTRARSGELRQVFGVEARQILDQAAALAARLATAPERAAATLEELGELFHRVKGSALLIGEPAVAAAAGRLQDLCEAGPTAAAAHDDVVAGLSHLRALAGVDRAAPPRRAPAGPLPPLRREPVKPIEAGLLEAFEQECAELIEVIEKHIVELEGADEPRGVVEALLRPYHTLKGAVSSIGMTAVGKELHRLEDFLEELLEAEVLPPPRTLAAFLIEVQAGLRKNLRLARQGHVETSVARLEARIALLRAGGRDEQLSFGSGSAPESSSGPPASSASAPAGSAPEAFEDSVAERRTLRVPAERLDSLMNLAGELVVSRSRLLARVDSVRGLYRDLSRSRRRLVETIEHFRERHEFTLGVRAPKPVEIEAAPVSTAGFSELELDRYDDVNVLARSLAEITDDVTELDTQLLTDLGAFSEDSEALSGLVSGIQSEVTSARMVPLESLFTRLRLAVRDAAERGGKEVRVVTEGEGVRLDKTIIDALFTPLLHLVRNAVGHGVETPAERAAAGKPSEGVVRLTGRQDSGQIVLEVRDDGAGLDLARLHQRGLAAGLIGAEITASDPAVKDLVFAPGLSTRDVAEEVSGRGIGGDVVKRAIQRLNGDIRVDTAAGRGTAFTVTLPITLAITRAVVVRHRDQAYAVPLYFAERVLAGDEARFVDSAGVRRIALDGELLNLDRLEECYGLPRESDAGPMLLLRVGDERRALQVDAVLGQEEIVVKRLGDLLGGHPLFSGMTVRGAGELVLILDVPGLMRRLVTRAPAPRPMTLYPAPRVEPAAPPAPPQRTRALWVDDSLSVRKVAEKELGSLDVETVVAVDGLDALAKLREGRFDILFADLEMPNMNGYELLREVRTNPALRTLPAVVVSSRSSAKHQQRAREHGANAFVTKPFGADTLARLLDEWVPAWRKGRP
jgi:chemosensory pili system protein ChpA (sensor histidine kinase/response regulator)